MSSLKYALRELIEIAVQIENGGERFYRYAAGKNEKVRDIFQILADDEKKHAVLFQSLLVPSPDYEYSGIDNIESIPYIRAIVDSTVLRYLLDRKEYPEKVGSVTDVLDFALGLEKESLLFYYQLVERIQGKGRPAVDRIIGEEKKHIEKILQLYGSSFPGS
jgi:rubrerythrin